MSKSHYGTSAKSNRLRSQPTKLRFEEREREIEIPNTLITYENNDEGDSSENQNYYDNFFNTKTSDDKNINDKDSDATDCDIPTEHLGEGLREIRTFDYNSDTYRDASEIQKVLDAIKKDNIEIKNKEMELKQKFEMMKEEYERLAREKAILEQRQHGKLNFL